MAKKTKDHPVEMQAEADNQYVEDAVIVEDEQPQPEEPQPAEEEVKYEDTETQVRYDFTERELLTMGSKIAMELAERNNLENDMKAIAASYKSRIKEVDSRIGVLQTNISSGWEMRTVRCQMFRDITTKERVFIDENGVEIKRQPFTSTDFQLAFPL